MKKLGKSKSSKNFLGRRFTVDISNLCFIAKYNGWEETIFSVLILRETYLLIGLSDTIMVAFFLSGIN